jgi:hypothetical protein
MDGGEERTPSNALKTMRHAMTVITENADPGLVTQGWVGNKPCLVTVDTGAYLTVAKYRSQMARKTSEPTFHAADGIWGSLPNPEKCFPNSDPEAAPTQNLGFRCRYHTRFGTASGPRLRLEITGHY